MTAPMRTIISGAAFGAALTAAGVYQPDVIISQFTMADWHMVRTFLTATASSTLIVYIAQSVGYRKAALAPREPSQLGITGNHDGNVVGGLMMGAGMALAGACPGTVLAQVAVGINSGVYALGGALMAGITWTGLLKPYITTSRSASVTPDCAKTWHGALQVGRGVAVLGSELMYAAIVITTVVFASSKTRPSTVGIIGGLGIGAAQLLSLAMRGKLVGVSSCYEEAGHYFWWGINRDQGSPKMDAILFSVGLMTGAWALASINPSFANRSMAEINPVMGFLGGFVMTLGARLSGGCTSGHGISGLSLLSISSLITIGSAMVAGAVVSFMSY